ncbi:MAG: hypothetical protein WDZ59_02095 [Pirellulales bacterium]
MRPMLETVTDLAAQAETIRARRYGVIEVRGRRLVAVRLRPLPTLLSLPELLPLGWSFRRWRYHRRGPADVCWVYYNQPRQFPNFLALKYLVSTRGTSAATCRVALEVLDVIARLKQTDALLCDVGNRRISDRLMARWGWEPHKPQRWHRNFIKRFYGEYPGVALPLGEPEPVCSEVA